MKVARESLSALVSVFFLLGPIESMACSCIGTPLLSPPRANATIVAADVVRHIPNELGYPQFMEIHITRTFRGDTLEQSIVVAGDSGIECLPSITNFPVGTQWLLGYEVIEGRDTPVLESCNRGIEIIADEIEGHIREKRCEAGDDDCAADNSVVERFTLDEFDILQEGFFSGVETAIDYCSGNQLAACPRLRARFTVDSRILTIPHIDIVESIFSDSDDPPLGVVEATLELIPDQDRLLLEVKEAWSK